jgi:putative pyruvate formate lyase activating enzyme
MTTVPSYIALHRSGELSRRAAALELLLESCSVCPHNCGNNRLKNDIARCHAGALPIVSSYTPHLGEEPGLGGTRGVGNIFFGNCTLRCVYCQNYEISQSHTHERAHEVPIRRLAAMMLELQDQGVHSIGFVSPSHFVPQIVRAVGLAAEGGLRLPLIYNTNAYDALHVLRLLDGIVDIYLPDLKYADEDLAYAYSGVKGYPRVAREAIAEMFRQVGTELLYNSEGVVRRGLVIRHLVLPNDIAGSTESFRWIRDTFGPMVTVSLMAQYYPAHKGATTPLLDRKIRQSEYDRVLAVLDCQGMEQGWAQEYDAPENYRPEFGNREDPFGNEEGKRTARGW